MSLSLLGGLRAQAAIRRRCLPKLVLPPDDDVAGASQPSANKTPLLELPRDDEGTDIVVSQPRPAQEAIELGAFLRPCCMCKCTAKIEEQAAEAALRLRDRLGQKDKSNFVFELIKQGALSNGKFKLFDLEMCQQAFCNVVNVSAGTVVKHKKAIGGGHYAPPPDQRAHNGGNNSHLNKQLDVDAFSTTSTQMSQKILQAMTQRAKSYC